MISIFSFETNFLGIANIMLGKLKPDLPDLLDSETCTALSRYGSVVRSKLSKAQSSNGLTLLSSPASVCECMCVCVFVSCFLFIMQPTESTRCEIPFSPKAFIQLMKNLAHFLKVPFLSIHSASAAK